MVSATLAPERHIEEDKITTRIEQVTSKIPSGVFLAIGMGAIVGSAVLALTGRTKQANFVGLWVPTVLILGIYNKLVKVHEPV